MSEEQALYVRDGGAFVGTECTSNAWDPTAQSGGAVLALLGHVLEDVPTLVPMSLSRLTVDMVRPVPVGRRLHLEPTVVREGKKIQLVDLVVTSDGTEHARARALRLRDADVTGAEGAPRTTTAEEPALALPRPEELARTDAPAAGGFIRFGIDLRSTDEPAGGNFGVWLRLLLPVVAGEPVRTTSRAALPMDLVNLIGARFDPRRVTAINPDVSAHLHRSPVGEWLALTGHTRVDHAAGHGVSFAAMSDDQGVFGVTSTSQLVQPLG